jgi:hypothetical protein
MFSTAICRATQALATLSVLTRRATSTAPERLHRLSLPKCNYDERPEVVTYV